MRAVFLAFCLLFLISFSSAALADCANDDDVGCPPMATAVSVPDGQIPVAPQDTLCMSDQDCTLVAYGCMESCCGGPAYAVNQPSAQKYQALEAQKTCPPKSSVHMCSCSGFAHAFCDHSGSASTCSISYQ